MSRLIRLGVASAVAAAALAPAVASAYTCTPRGVEKKTTTVGGQTVEYYGIYWVC